MVHTVIMYRNLTSRFNGIALFCTRQRFVILQSLREASVNLTLPELDYKNVFLFLLLAGTQHPTPLDFLNVPLKIG